MTARFVAGLKQPGFAFDGQVGDEWSMELGDEKQRKNANAAHQGCSYRRVPKPPAQGQPYRWAYQKG